MVCLYCGSDTRVVNSRLQRRPNQIWRRRACLDCHNIFSTTEGIDYGQSLVVRNKIALEPFSRDILLLSIHDACGHRKDAVRAATALTATVISKLLPLIQEAIIERSAIIRVSTEVLSRFDKAAGITYGAYHPL